MDKFWRNPGEDLQFFQLKQHFAPVDAVLIMAGGRLCVSGSRDRSIGIWDLTKLTEEEPQKAFKQSLDGHKGWVWSLACDPMGESRLCSGSWDNSVKVWDLRGSIVEMTSIREHRAAVLCMEWKQDVLVTGCYDKHVRMFDLRDSNRVIAKLKYHSRPVLCLTVDDHFIVSGSEDKTMCVYDRRACSLLKTIQLASPAFSMCHSLRTGYNYLRVGGRAGNIYLIDVTNEAYNPVESSIDLELGPKGKINGICHYGGAVVASSSDHSIKILEPSQVPTEICSLNRHTGDVASVNSCSGVLASASSDLSVGIWRPKSWNLFV
ncbi:F-box/WD repeat-containing protein 9 isoform X2 [Nematostella vectensis]|nr:F-box/WD repeat-containing protein 9 isoform X2 [Nematostella vectensis]XP_048589402.1 F-box/WD repeat-containing protein 9 isoform X2 [Nematostella vectensis]